MSPEEIQEWQARWKALGYNLEVRGGQYIVTGGEGERAVLELPEHMQRLYQLVMQQTLTEVTHGGPPEITGEPSEATVEPPQIVQDATGQWWRVIPAQPAVLDPDSGEIIQAARPVDYKQFTPPGAEPLPTTYFSSREIAQQAAAESPDDDVPYQVGDAAWKLVRVPKPADFGEAIFQAVLAGDDEEADRLRAQRDRFTPYEQYRMERERGQDIYSQAQDLLTQQTAQQREATRQQEFQQQYGLDAFTAQQNAQRQALGQALDIQRSPGDWWLYMNALRSQDPTFFGGGIPRPEFLEQAARMPALPGVGGTALPSPTGFGTFQTPPKPAVFDATMARLAAGNELRAPSYDPNRPISLPAPLSPLWTTVSEMTPEQIAQRKALEADARLIQQT